MFDVMESLVVEPGSVETMVNNNSGGGGNSYVNGKNKHVSQTARSNHRQGQTSKENVANAGKQSQSINYSRYKTEMCRQYSENGECKYGDKCQFAHGVSELKDVSRHPKYKTDFCKTFHSKGFCPYGPRCHFIHELNETNSTTVAAPSVATNVSTNGNCNQTLPQYSSSSSSSSSNSNSQSPSPNSSSSRSNSSSSDSFLQSSSPPSSTLACYLPSSLLSSAIVSPSAVSSSSLSSTCSGSSSSSFQTINQLNDLITSLLTINQPSQQHLSSSPAMTNLTTNLLIDSPPTSAGHVRSMPATSSNHQQQYPLYFKLVKNR